jgi:hypothetical protein
VGDTRGKAPRIHFITRTTEDKLCDVLDRAEAAEAEVVLINYRGGRDYTVISRGVIPGPAGSRVFRSQREE